MTKKQLLEQLEQTYCRIGISKIHGVGVIAIRDIPKGTNPFVGSCKCKYTEISKKETKSLPKEIRNMIHDFYIVKKDSVMVPSCGFNGMDISYFMNYSKTPNVYSLDGGDTYATNRKIKKGEELTLDYIRDYGEYNTLETI